MKKMIKKGLETKAGKIAIGGTIALTIFGGGIASGSYVLNSFNYGKSSNVMARIDFLGQALKTEVSKKWGLFDENETLKAQITGLNDQIAQKQAEIDQLKIQLSQGDPVAQARIIELETQVSQLQQQITILEGEKATMQQDINTLNQSITDANNSVNAYDQQLTNIITEYNNGSRPQQ